jgi:hypothetical protein
MSIKDELINNKRDDYCSQWTWMDDTMDNFKEKDRNRSNMLAPEVHQRGDFNPILHLKAVGPRPDG